MRPKVRYATKNRLVRVARDVDDSLPEDRDLSFEEALTAVLDYAESIKEGNEGLDLEELEEKFSMGNMGTPNQPRQPRGDPFGNNRGGFTK